MSCTKALFSIGALTALLAFAPRAQADCKVDADCGKGFTCDLITAQPAPTTAPCAPDQDCKATTPAVDAGTPVTTGYCVEASCKTDSDCGAGMICHTEVVQSCSGGSACPAGAECFAPSGGCTSQSISSCAYKWQLPCNVAADCGEGFTCNPSVSGSCSGGSGVATPGMTGSASAGTAGTNAPAPSATAGTGGSTPADTCTTTESFPGWCAAKATTCNVDSDCPAAWTCVEQAVAIAGGTAGTSGATTNTSSIAPGEPAPSGGATTPPATTKVCQAPGAIYRGANDGSGHVEVVSGGTAGTGGSQTTSSGAAGSSAPTAGKLPPSSGASASGSSSGSGCAVGGAAGGSALAAALALLGLVVARRRR